MKMLNMEFLLEKRFTVSSHLMQIAMEHHLSLVEFLLLMPYLYVFIYRSNESYCMQFRKALDTHDYAHHLRTVRDTAET